MHQRPRGHAYTVCLILGLLSLTSFSEELKQPTAPGEDAQPFSLHSDRLNPDIANPSPKVLPVVALQVPKGWKKSVQQENASRMTYVSGAVPLRREARLILKAPGKGWDVYDKLWLVLDVTNRGREPVLVRLGTEFGMGQLGADRIVPGTTRPVPALVFRNLRDRHAYLEEKMEEVFGMPGGHVENWRKVDAGAIKQLPVHINSRDASVDLVIGGLRAVTAFDPPSRKELQDGFVPYVDRFGQARHDRWEGKVESVEDLKNRAGIERQHLLSRPTSWSRYGGWAKAPRLEATGHFYTHKADNTWWLVDPEGHLFWSFGITCVRADHDQQKPVTTPGLQQILDEIPANEPGIGPFIKQGGRTWHPYSANLFRKYGKDWVSKAAHRSHDRLAAWGVNTIANWSSRAVTRLKKTPYTQCVHYDFPSLRPGRTSFQSHFPDVFAPDFARSLRLRMEYELGRTTEDPWCIGYFVDNEMPFVRLDTIINSIKQAPAEAHSKKALRAMLQKKYGTIDALNASWKTAYTSWEAFPADDALPDSPGYKEDGRTYAQHYLHTYFKTCRDVVKSVAPHKLYLGSRIHQYFPEIFEICAEYADVVSVNLYQYSPRVLTHLQTMKADKPFVIGEFHFGTLCEKGTWGPGLIPASNLENAARLMTHYLEDALADPRIVGAHWFQYRDQIVSGRGDGENYRIGFVDITDTPYPDMTRAARKIGERMYDQRMKWTRP